MKLFLIFFCGLAMSVNTADFNPAAKRPTNSGLIFIASSRDAAPSHPPSRSFGAAGRDGSQ